jgi:CheY-like chemotaxis protein
MKALLEDACTVLEAGDGREGVEQARHHKPDLILMDLALPVMDGFAALAAIREDETLQCYSSTSCFPALILRSSALTRNDPLVLG